jgi:hypothetical protein
VAGQDDMAMIISDSRCFWGFSLELIELPDSLYQFAKQESGARLICCRAIEGVGTGLAR